VAGFLQADLPGGVWGNPESWPRWRALLPSVLAATGYHTGTTGGETISSLLTGAGDYLRRQGRYVEALALYQRSLRICETAFGPDHLDVAAGLSDVGLVLSVLGRHAEALPLQERLAARAAKSLTSRVRRPVQVSC